MSGIEEMKYAKTQLMNCVVNQVGDISKVDSEELGDAIDMIKDLAEAIYYCTITDAMEKGEDGRKEQTYINYYGTPYYHMPASYPEKDRTNYMYYPSGNGSSGGSGNSGGGMRGFQEPVSARMFDVGRDPREGRSPMRRRMYMEGKENHNDPKSQLMELEAYLQELSTDITEMTKNASTEEKATLRRKMATLADKIV